MFKSAIYIYIYIQDYLFQSLIKKFADATYSERNTQNTKVSCENQHLLSLYPVSVIEWNKFIFNKGNSKACFLSRMNREL